MYDCEHPTVARTLYRLEFIISKISQSEYALVVAWEWIHESNFREVDLDNPDDIDLLYEHARFRAAAFNIQGVTRDLTLGVVKRIIPAIASTNQVIGSMLVHQVRRTVYRYYAQMLRVLLGNFPLSGTYTLYNGAEGCSISSLDLLPDPVSINQLARRIRVFPEMSGVWISNQ